MPGILPMKVIRIGSSAQSRIAQACDRCRSKKIRCDGVRPYCSQCSNVGFECKTSDKLSRRAFPRGYTESLEDRVRGLEAEVRELKYLLDEKDEKIDMLSRIHNFSPASSKRSACLSATMFEKVEGDLEAREHDLIQIESPARAASITSSPQAPSTAAFIESFERKAQGSGKRCREIRPSSFTHHSLPASTWSTSAKGASKIPPRLLSDQYINIFFQEWAPLLPVLHRPSFLKIYESYLADPDAGHWHRNKQAIAQLFLIFEIAALSSISRIKQSTTSYEPQWRKALQSSSSTASFDTIQCHVLAQLYFLLKADYAHLARHRAVAVSMSHQLGLHQSQKYYAIRPMDSEMRKKVFWSQYVLDRFASVASGTPMLLREADISSEYPSDIDDETFSEQGSCTTMPGPLTKISSGLALFQVTRILSKVLEELYPAAHSYQLSINKLHSISDELDQWLQSLAPHLRLEFSKDKPSTNVISDRSPLLSLAYFFIRGLIYRPVVCHGSGSSLSASIIALADSAKHIIQIFELLEDRRMNYTFPFNKSEVLLSSGFALLWQSIDLRSDSKLIKDNQISLNSLVDILTRDSAIAGMEFHKVASSFVPITRRQSPTQSAKHVLFASQQGRLLDPMSEMSKHKSARKHLQAIASRWSSFGNRPKPEVAPRRATFAHLGPGAFQSPHDRTFSTLSTSSTRSMPVLPLKLQNLCSADLPSPTVNLDFFPFGEDDPSTIKGAPQKESLPESAWEEVLENIDNGGSNIFEGICGDISPRKRSSPYNEAEQVMPNSQGCGQQQWPISVVGLSSKDAVLQSVLSLSDESLTSGEEFLSGSGSHNGSHNSGTGLVNHDSPHESGAFRGIPIPADDHIDFGGSEAQF